MDNKAEKVDQILSKEGDLIKTVAKKIWLPEDITDAFIETRPLSYSKLKKFRVSPKHYVHALNKPWEDTDATILGSAVDTLALEPEKLEENFLIYENFEKRTAIAKEKWAGMVLSAQKNKQKLITKEQLKVAELMVESLMSVEEAKQLLESRKNVQKKLSWRDKKTNINLIGYQDFESNAWDNDWIVDLKTSRSADPLKFVRDVFGDLDYFTQVGSYLDYHHKKQYRFPDFIFLVVENVEPYGASVNYIESKDAEAAKIEFNASLQAFRYALDNKLFHQGYEFRNQTGNYSALRKPAYYKPKF